MMSIRQVGLSLIPNGEVALTYSSAGAAIFLRRSDSETQLTVVTADLMARGWTSARVVLDKCYEIDPMGTDEEQQIHKSLDSGHPLCNLFVNPHKSLGPVTTFTLEDFDEYAERVASIGAGLVPDRHGPKIFKLDGESVVPLIAWPERAHPVWKTAAKRRGLRHLLHADLVQFLSDEAQMKRGLVIDIVPGSWVTWHPAHLLRAITGADR